MADKRKFTASANVKLTVEVMNLGPYGDDWPASKIHDQTAQQAVQQLQRLLSAGQKALRGIKQDGQFEPVPGVRIVGEPEVTIVSARQSK